MKPQITMTATDAVFNIQQIAAPLAYKLGSRERAVAQVRMQHPAWATLLDSDANAAAAVSAWTSKPLYGSSAAEPQGKSLSDLMRKKFQVADEPSAQVSTVELMKRRYEGTK